MKEKRYYVEMTVEEYADYIERKYQPGKENVVRGEIVEDIICDDVMDELIERGYSKEQVLLFMSRYRKNDSVKDNNCEAIEVRMDELDRQYIIHSKKSYPEPCVEYYYVKQFLSKESVHNVLTKTIVQMLIEHNRYIKLVVPGGEYIEYRLIDRK